MTSGTLPIELVLAVAEHLEQAELTQLVLVNKAFYDVGEPLMFKRLELCANSRTEALFRDLAGLQVQGDQALSLSNLLGRHATRVQVIDFRASQLDTTRRLCVEDSFVQCFTQCVSMFEDLKAIIWPFAEGAFHHAEHMWEALLQLDKLYVQLSSAVSCVLISSLQALRLFQLVPSVSGSFAMPRSENSQCRASHAAKEAIQGQRLRQSEEYLLEAGRF